MPPGYRLSRLSDRIAGSQCAVTRVTGSCQGVVTLGWGETIRHRDLGQDRRGYRGNHVFLEGCKGEMIIYCSLYLKLHVVVCNDYILSGRKNDYMLWLKMTAYS